MEEKFLELLELAKQNGSQATTVLLEIEQLLNGENEQIQELLESAKQNGTQATTVLLEIEQILCGDDEQYQELLEKAKQNGSQATTVITELVETRGVEPQPIPVEGDVQIFKDAACTEYATGVVNKVYARVNEPWGENEEWSVSNNFLAAAPSTEYPDDPYRMVYYSDFMSGDFDVPYETGQVIELACEGSIDVTNFNKVFSKPQ